MKQVFATGSRARLLSWSDEGAATHTIVQPNAASALTANYNVQYLVKATVDNPLHGSIFVSPSSSDGYYDLGMMVTFTAKPKTGYGFSDIVLNGTPASTNPLVLQITVPVNVVAEFSN